MSDTNSLSSLSPIKSKYVKEEKKWKILSDLNLVQMTGDWASDSKFSAILQDYWEDPFFRFFNKTDPAKLRRTSLICKGYYVRYRVCDYFLRNFLRHASQPVQVVNLGSGMDTSFFRLLPELELQIAAYYELDFKQVISAKKSIISHNEILRLMADDKLILLSYDLKDLSSLREVLENANFQFDKPSLFYSECVVNYLEPNESRAILEWITKNVQNAVWLAYEQCYPDDTFGRIMTNHFERSGCPLKSLSSAPDPLSQKSILIDANFDVAEVFNAWDAFLHIGNESPPHFPVEAISKKEHQFDEYESLLVTCLHYSVRIGLKGDVGQIPKFLNSTSLHILNLHTGVNLPITEDDENSDFSIHVQYPTNLPKLSGHTVTTISPSNKILTFGGCGENSVRMKHLIQSKFAFPEDSKNKPEKNSFELDNRMENSEGEEECNQNTDEPIVVSRILLENPKYYERMYASATFLLSHSQTTAVDSSEQDESSIVIFGGRQSPRNPCNNDLIQIKTQQNILETVMFSSSNDECCPKARWRHSLICISQQGFSNQDEVPCNSDTTTTDSSSSSNCSGPILLLYGGRNTEEVLGDAWIFNVYDKQWKQVTLSPGLEFRFPRPRHSHSMTVDETKSVAYLVGGISTNDTSLCQDAFWIFEYGEPFCSWIHKTEWDCFSRRIGHSVHNCNNKILIVGGYGPDSSYTLQHFVTVIDLQTEQFRYYELNISLYPEQLFLPFGFGSCITKSTLGTKHLVLFGGGGSCFSFGTHYNQMYIILSIKQ